MVRACSTADAALRAELTIGGPASLVFQWYFSKPQVADLLPSSGFSTKLLKPSVLWFFSSFVFVAASHDKSVKYQASID